MLLGLLLVLGFGLGLGAAQPDVLAVEGHRLGEAEGALAPLDRHGRKAVGELRDILVIGRRQPEREHGLPDGHARGESTGQPRERDEFGVLTRHRSRA